MHYLCCSSVWEQRGRADEFDAASLFDVPPPWHTAWETTRWQQHATETSERSEGELIILLQPHNEYPACLCGSSCTRSSRLKLKWMEQNQAEEGNVNTVYLSLSSINDLCSQSLSWIIIISVFSTLINGQSNCVVRTETLYMNIFVCMYPPDLYLCYCIM